MHAVEARLILGAAVIDDVLGLVILGVVSGIAAGTAVTFFGVARALAVAVGFLVVAVVVGAALMPRVFGFVDRMRVRGVLLVSAFAFLLLLAALAAASARKDPTPACGRAVSRVHRRYAGRHKITHRTNRSSDQVLVSAGLTRYSRERLVWRYAASRSGLTEICRSA